jgi:heme exporter protein C
VYWWNTLHQPSTLTRLGKPAMAGEMLWPLLAMLLAFTLFFAAVFLVRWRGEILQRERRAGWLKTELER